MATIADTKKAIKAVPNMIADCTEGEWRVTVTLDAMKAAYPDEGASWWAERREAIAHYTNDADDALATAKSMSGSWEKEKAMATENNTTPARERVYDFDHRQQGAFETMFARLREKGFHPKPDIGPRDGKHMSGITLPANEVAELRALQYAEARTWGNHPAVARQLAENSAEMVANAERRKERLEALTPDQREFIEMLHYQSKDRLQVDAALDLNDKLHELSAQHQRLAHIKVNEGGLSEGQERVRGDIEMQVISLVQQLPGALEPKFTYDPRGTTVGVMFESGANNSLNGSFKVPLNPERVKALAAENFQGAIDALQRADDERGPVRRILLRIDNTANAAFVDAGRIKEVVRIIDEAADKLDSVWSNSDGERYPLHDLNGNTVGLLEFAKDEKATFGDAHEGGVKISVWCELDNDAYQDDPAHEAAQHLREAAHRINTGSTDFPIYDTNGNHVGDGTIRALPSLEKDGRVDMDEALKSGSVYLAEDGYSGIADGEFRYVVPTNDFEPGYHQGQGDAWLVNAKGELASGYDEPQPVKENVFRALNASERAALLEVVEGRVTFEDFEKQFEDEDPAP